MNIDYENNGYRFTTRSSAVIFSKDKTKVLLCRGEDRDYYMLPGGRIEMYEDSKSAIVREIEEELGYQVDFKLNSIQENFIERDNIKITQYCFCYEGIYEGEVNNEEFTCIDNPWQLFKWININEMDNYKIVPHSTKSLISNKHNGIKHIIERKD